MAVIKAFRGLHPKAEFAAEVAAPPYDVLSSDEARALVKKNQNSFLRVNKSEVDFSAEESQYTDKVYLKGKENLQRLINDGLMIRDEKESLYLYRLTMNNKSQIGLVALTSVDEYNRGLIKKHELTRPEKVDDRADHILTLEAQVGPVFSIFKQNENLKNLFKKLTSETPSIDFTADDKVRHELWIIDSEEDVASLVNQFGQLDAIYIADGHHRSEAASEVCRRMKEKNQNHTGNENYNYFLNVIFPDDEMYIMSYNRTISDLQNHTMPTIIEKLSDSFDIETSENPIEPSDKHILGIYHEKIWYKAVIKDGSFDTEHPVDSIDSAILTKNLLAPLFNIENLRTDNRIKFVGGIRGIAELEKLVNSGEQKMAFSLPPVTVNQLLAVADAGEVMPPKSTWFEPKLRSGMVVSLLED